MLGFSVSQATVSRYLPAPSRRPGQSWRTFLRSQASAFGQYTEERSDGYAGPRIASYSVDLMESAAAQIATGQRQPTLNTERINPRSAQRDRGVAHGACRVASVPYVSGRALEDRSGGRSSDTKSAPSSLGVAMVVASRDSRGRVSAASRQISLRRFMIADTSNSSSHRAHIPGDLSRPRSRGSGFEKEQVSALTRSSTRVTDVKGRMITVRQ